MKNRPLNDPLEPKSGLRILFTVFRYKRNMLVEKAVEFLLQTIYVPATGPNGATRRRIIE